MTTPYSKTTVQNWLVECKNFINTYTRDASPFILNSRYINRKEFHTESNKDNLIDSRYGTSQCQASLAFSCLKSFQITNDISWKNLGLSILNSYVKNFYISDIPSNPSLSDTPYLHNWLCVSADVGVTMENDSTYPNLFNYGYYDFQYSFTNGVSNTGLVGLKKVFSAHNGKLLYRNLKSPIIKKYGANNGVSMEIDYWVVADNYSSSKYRVYPDGTKILTTDDVGKIVLKDLSFSGNLYVVHTRWDYNNLALKPVEDFSGRGLANVYPLSFLSVKSGRTTHITASFNALWKSYEAFTKAYEITLDIKWLNAANATKYAIINSSSVENKSYIHKKSTSVLGYVGSAIYQTNNLLVAGYSTSIETSPDKLNFLKIVVNAAIENSKGETQVTNDVTQFNFDADSKMFIELASSIDNVYYLNVDTVPDSASPPKIYTATFFVKGGSTPYSKTFIVKDFADWASCVWHPTINGRQSFDISTSKAGDSATCEYLQDNVDNYSQAIANFKLKSGLDSVGAGGFLLNFKNTTTPPAIKYKLSGVMYVNIRDSEGKLFTTYLYDTNGQWLTLPGTWTAYNNVGNLQPSTGNILQIAFKPANNNVVNDLSVAWVGDEPIRLPLPNRGYKVSVTSKSIDLHTIWLGNYNPIVNSLDTINYSPGVVSRTVNNNAKNINGSFFAPGYTNENILSQWGFQDRVFQALQFKTDAQKAYTLQSISQLEAPMMPGYLTSKWENPDFISYGDTIKYQGFDTNVYGLNKFTFKNVYEDEREIGILQTYSFLNTAKYLRRNSDNAQARKLVTSWLQWINKYIDTTGKVPTDYKPGSEPTSATSPNISIIAILGQTAIHANIAGVEVAMTHSLITKLFNLMNNNYTDTGVMKGSFTLLQPQFIADTFYKNYYCNYHSDAIDFLNQYLEDIDLLKTPLGIIPGFLPAIKPNYITEYSDSNLPISINKSGGGVEQRIQYLNTGSNKKLTVDYQKIPYSEMRVMVEFYASCYGNYRSFSLPTELISFEDYNGQWVIDESFVINPVVSNKEFSLWNFTIKLKSVGM